MADNVNPQAVAFANTRIRPAADLLEKAYWIAKALVNDWNAQNVAAVIPPGDATLIGDGSAVDGRPRITNDNAYGIVLQAQSFVTGLEAANAANLTAIQKVAVNGLP